jgi:sugar/nucleoside kinase (ribokinase family)
LGAKKLQSPHLFGENKQTKGESQVKLSTALNSGSRPVDVVVLGENSIDLVATVGEFPTADSKLELDDFAEWPGGEGAAAAVGLTRLGWRATYVGRLGDDPWGQRGRLALANEGVDVEDCVVVRGVTSRFAIILVDGSSRSRTVLWRRAPELALEPADIKDDLLRRARVLLVGSDDVPAMTSAARRARRQDVRTVGDLERIHAGTDALLRELDVVIMAATFPAAYTGIAQLGAALKEVAKQSGAALTCVTLGVEGCLALAAGEELRVPAFPMDAVDTTGAGDLFRAGFIARWLREPAGPDVGELLRYAAAVAALNCRGRGAWASAPRAPEVEALLQSWRG